MKILLPILSVILAFGIQSNGALELAARILMKNSPPETNEETEALLEDDCMDRCLGREEMTQSLCEDLCYPLAGLNIVPKTFKIDTSSSETSGETEVPFEVDCMDRCLDLEGKTHSLCLDTCYPLPGLRKDTISTPTPVPEIINISKTSTSERTVGTERSNKIDCLEWCLYSRTLPKGVCVHACNLVRGYDALRNVLENITTSLPEKSNCFTVCLKDTALKKSVCIHICMPQPEVSEMIGTSNLAPSAAEDINIVRRLISLETNGKEEQCAKDCLKRCLNFEALTIRVCLDICYPLPTIDAERNETTTFPTPVPETSTETTRETAWSDAMRNESTTLPTPVPENTTTFTETSTDTYTETEYPMGMECLFKWCLIHEPFIKSICLQICEPLPDAVTNGSTPAPENINITETSTSETNEETEKPIRNDCFTWCLVDVASTDDNCAYLCETLPVSTTEDFFTTSTYDSIGTTSISNTSQTNTELTRMGCFRRCLNGEAAVIRICLGLCHRFPDGNETTSGNIDDDRVSNSTQISLEDEEEILVSCYKKCFKGNTSDMDVCMDVCNRFPEIILVRNETASLIRISNAFQKNWETEENSFNNSRRKNCFYGCLNGETSKLGICLNECNRFPGFHLMWNETAHLVSSAADDIDTRNSCQTEESKILDCFRSCFDGERTVSGCLDVCNIEGPRSDIFIPEYANISTLTETEKMEVWRRGCMQECALDERTSSRIFTVSPCPNICRSPLTYTILHNFYFWGVFDSVLYNGI